MEQLRWSGKRTTRKLAKVTQKKSIYTENFDPDNKKGLQVTKDVKLKKFFTGSITD